MARLLAVLALLASAAAAAPLRIRAADMSALGVEDCALQCNRFKASPSSAPEDALRILARADYNTIRLRVWVHPAANHSDGSLENVVALSARAAAANLSVWVDFHLSDWWADPGHQAKPAAWAALALPQLAGAVSAHVADTLAAVAAVARVALVQVGNEVSPGALFPEAGQACADSGRLTQPCSGANWPALGGLLAAGIAAARAAAPGALIALHTDLGNRGAYAAADAEAWYRAADAALAPAGAVYDVIALSYYARYGATGPGGLASLAAALRAAFPGRALLLAETSYPWAGSSAPLAYAPSPGGQLQFWRDTAGNASAAGLLGVAWWGGEYAGSWTALFDEDFVALPALRSGFLTSTEAQHL